MLELVKWEPKVPDYNWIPFQPEKYIWGTSKSRTQSVIEPKNTRAFWDLKDNLIPPWLYKMKGLRLREICNFLEIMLVILTKPGLTSPWSPSFQICSYHYYNMLLLCPISENMLRACIFCFPSLLLFPNQLLIL